MPLLHHGRYRDLAGAIAARLNDAPQQEVIVASAGLAGAIIAELLRGRAGLAGLRLQTIDAFARRPPNGAIDPADLLGRAAALAPNANPQIVAGFYDMTAMQMRLIEASQVEAVYVPAGEGSAYKFATPFVNALCRTGFSPSLPSARAEALPTLVSVVMQYENRIEEMQGVCDEIAN